MSGLIAAPITSSATRDLWKVAETGDVGQLIELLARGADVNASNQAGVTALMLAAYHGRLEMVRALTDHGADVNATDRDGFTAAMLAQHSHREDIVRLLVARGARRIPKLYAAETASAILAAYPPADALHVSNPSEKKILDAPPNIWDVVHETHVAFDARSAFVGHLRSINPQLFALIAIIVGGAAVMGFIWLRGWTETPPTASGVKTESSTNQIVPSSSPVNTPDSTVSSADQQSGSQATAPIATESPSPQQSAMATAATRLASSALNPKIAAPTPGERPRRVAAKANQPDQSFASPVGGATPNGTANTGNPEKGQTSTTPAAQTDAKKSVDPVFENKEPQKVPTPAPVVPVKAKPTPNQ